MRRVILIHKSGLREILGTIETSEITEDAAGLEYSDDGETMKRAVLVVVTPKRVVYREVTP
jgi:hypothetical protein